MKGTAISAHLSPGLISRRLISLWVAAYLSVASCVPLVASSHECETAKSELATARELLGARDSSFYPQAENLIRGAVQRCPGDPGILRLAASAYDDLGNDAQAEHLRQRASSIEEGLKSTRDVGPAPPDVDRPKRSLTPSNENLGLIIAIQRYPKASEVTFAEGDAEVMQDYFVKVLHLRPDHIYKLTGQAATRDRIVQTVQQLVGSARSEATLYVYYAGHGYYIPEMRKNLIVPYDFDSHNLPQTTLRLDEFYEQIERGREARAIVFLDSCFSGAAAHSDGNKGVIEGERPIIRDISTAPPKKVFVLAATSPEQVSMAFESARHGLYTYYLLRGLNGEAAAGADGWITLKSLFDYVQAGVTAEAGRRMRDQVPTLLFQSDPTQVRLVKVR